MWIPDLSKHHGPRYLAIASALAEDIENGRLPPGTQLPTHRALADALRVTVGTVTRAYKEAAHRNLIGGEVGRGTYVRGATRREESLVITAEEPSGTIDLTVIRPAVEPDRTIVESTLVSLVRGPHYSQLLSYQPDAGMPHHREAGALWIQRAGLAATPEQVVVTSGGQNALAVILAAITHPGDTVLTESLTYPGTKGVAKVLHLNLLGLAMDEEGLLPEAFETACHSGTVRVLYTIPTLHNPTTAVLSSSRRERIAGIARRHGVTLIEDDVFGLSVEGAPPPLAQFAPERCYYIASTSKNLAPGLRVGYALTPEGQTSRVAGVIRSFSWMTTPLTAELAATWIMDGTAERITGQQRNETAARYRMAAELLEGFSFRGHPGANHLWLSLPEPWRVEDFVTQARNRNVLISPSHLFAVGRSSPPHAVRIGLGGPRRRESLERGLSTLASILREPPEPIFSTA